MLLNKNREGERGQNNWSGQNLVDDLVSSVCGDDLLRSPSTL